MFPKLLLFYSPKYTWGILYIFTDSGIQQLLLFDFQIDEAKAFAPLKRERVFTRINIREFMKQTNKQTKESLFYHITGISILHLISNHSHVLPNMGEYSWGQSVAIKGKGQYQDFFGRDECILHPVLMIIWICACVCMCVCVNFIEQYTKKPSNLLYDNIKNKNNLKENMNYDVITNTRFLMN